MCGMDIKLSTKWDKVFFLSMAKVRNMWQKLWNYEKVWQKDEAAKESPRGVAAFEKVSYLSKNYYKLRR